MQDSPLSPLSSSSPDEDLIAAGYHEGGIAAELARRLNLALAELSRIALAADAADRARRTADDAGAVGGWVSAVSGAV